MRLLQNLPGFLAWFIYLSVLALTVHSLGGETESANHLTQSVGNDIQGTLIFPVVVKLG